MNIRHSTETIEVGLMRVGRSGEVSSELIRTMGLEPDLDRLAETRIADAGVVELDRREIIAAILASRMVLDAIRRAAPKSAAGL